MSLLGIRVISGSAKGRRLKVVPGDTTRPIMDRVKENLFNLISADYVHNNRWLDLFGGTGSVGIEALSRGASHVTFVDKSRTAIRVLRENLATTQLADQALIRHADAFQFLEKLNDTPFDVVYIAPPQYHGMWVGAVIGVEQNLDQFVAEDGIVVVQIDPKEYMELTLSKLTLYKQRTYGTTMLCFYERSSGIDADLDEATA
ncbi:MAG: 16S rRNA (guanine(966)-N(2))-methyltransferase RsmD [Candidatus Promineifilaceae bacterium]